METANGNKNGHSANGYRFIFDDFEVDPVNRILLRSGTIVPLTAKVFDVLLVFVENAGRLIEKDELFDRVWQDSFVEEGNLARNVSTLRKALGDVEREHKYIVTVQGRGYRFLARVNELGEEPREIVSDDDDSGRLERSDAPDGPFPDRGADNTRSDQFANSRNKRYWMFSLGAVVVLGLAIFGLQLGFSPTRPKQDLAFEHIRQTKLTQDGNVVSPVISADGQYLAYVAVSGNDQGLCLRQIATGSVLRLLPTRPGIRYWGLAIAPDNSFVYYILREEHSDYGSLFRVPLLGGEPRKLSPMAAGGVAASPDGVHVAFTRIDRQAGTTSLMIVSNDGSDEATVTSVELDSLYHSLDWSPDGKNLVYVLKQRDAERDRWYIAEIPAAGGSERQIGEWSDTKIIAAKWMPDKSGLVVNAVDEATRQPQLYFMSYPDAVRRRITNDLNNYYGFSLTADGRSIVTAQSNSNRQIWALPGTNESGAVQITGGTEKHFETVSWLRNEYLIFDEDENSSYDNYNIWRTRPDGSEPQQLTFGNGNNSQPTVSPDGGTIVFVSRRSGKRQIWRMNADGTGFEQLTRLPQDLGDPRLLSDGRTIFFASYIGGKRQIWRTSVMGGKATPVVDADVYEWAVSPDGLQLAYSFFDRETAKVQTRIHKIDASGPDRILDIVPETWMLWAPDGQGIYYNTSADVVRNVWRANLDGAPPTQVTKFKDERIFGCAWSAGGAASACIRQTITYDAVMIHFD